MNKSRSGARGSRWYEQLKVVDDMNDIRSRAQASRYYEMLKAFIDLKNFESALDKMINSVLSLK